MQFTNIARDVGEDARTGRLYLPGAWMREAGLDPAAWLASPVLDERLRRVLRRMLGAADLLYARAEAGIGLLPLDCRPAIHAASRIYAAIGRDAEAADLDVLGRRARVSGRQGRPAWAIPAGDGARGGPLEPAAGLHSAAARGGRLPRSARWTRWGPTRRAARPSAAGPSGTILRGGPRG